MGPPIRSMALAEISCFPVLQLLTTHVFGRTTNVVVFCKDAQATRNVVGDQSNKLGRSLVCPGQMAFSGRMRTNMRADDYVMRFEWCLYVTKTVVDGKLAIQSATVLESDVLNLVLFDSQGLSE
ncbi:hypothetical protein LX32DRAFT_720500 [Colletotrichum zoysiae]|uniref:Uncharacterized protein n=1 Tax=Colletotrichum zoysiae TaxID=1216348 RepID=A0AAD9M1D5_9PEZI|nr:hypothetical protein LX32DRAFT_720500 [Colletotrichum zoysiae]